MNKPTKRIVSLMLTIILCFGVWTTTAVAAEDPVAYGSIGLSFGGKTAVISGEKVEGGLYTYDVGGSDAFNITFSYDATAFSDLTVEGTDGVTILAMKPFDNLVSVVFMVDPAVADYSNLLTITATAGPDETVGSIAVASVEAAKQGGAVELTIVDSDNIFTVVSDSLITEYNIQTLSKAMTFFMFDKTSPNWALAVKYDMNSDGVIDLQDFIKIANAILDTQRVSELKFNEDGRFKIMQMSDFQDYINSTQKQTVNQKSIALMNAALDAEKPDLVVFTGDQIGGNMNAEQLQDCIRQMVKPMEDRKIPWMVTFGNHDEDATTALNAGWNKIQQLAFYRSFAYNVNRASMSGVQGFEPNGKNTFGVGDMYQLIYDNKGEKPLYNVWALDSNRYDASGKGIGGYDWIRPEQIQWYSKTSTLLEAKYGSKINSLMFYHIPTPEWSAMNANRDKFGVVGEKNETECPANLNSGLFAATLARGDVRGMFVGHDHVNDYVGNYYGIYLGYDANVGYQTYGLGGSQNDRMRGVRVFEIDQNDLSAVNTRMVRAGDLGLN